MSLVTTILPIVFLILIVVGINIGRKYVTVKITHWLLFIYIGILLLSIAVVPFISGGMPKKRSNQVQGFYNALTNGKIDQIDNKYLTRKMSFDYKNSMLNIVSNMESLTTSLLREKIATMGKLKPSFIAKV